MEEYSNLQEVSWDQVRLDVYRVNKELAHIIDKIDPPKKYTFVKANYAFGDLVVKHGTTYLPPNDPEIDAAFKKKLSYSAIPLMLVLQNSNEVFIDTGSRTIPLNLFYPGSLLGLFETMDFMFKRRSKPIWSVSAGGRNIFMLSKITENGGLNRLRIHYGLSSSFGMQQQSNHWKMFTAITNSQGFAQSWQNTILFFTKDWFQDHLYDANWAEFRSYIFRQGWSQAQFALSKIEQGLNWETFVDAISARNLKPRPYLADQVKHIMAIAQGQWPAFRPADNSQQVAPTNELQDALINCYHLKHHLPTIMHIAMLNPLERLPLYYSLSLPTLLEGSPRDSSVSTIMLNLRTIKLLNETIQQAFDKIVLTDDPLKGTRFDYYHVDPDIYNEICSSKLIPAQDPRFLQDAMKFPERTFCASSSFWRGCIRII